MPSTLNKPQQELLKEGLIPILQENLGMPYAPQYEGELVSGPTGLQQAAFGMAGQYGTSQLGQQREQAIQGILSGQLPAAQGTDLYNRLADAQSARARQSFYGRGGAIDQILQAYGSSGPSGAVYDQLGSASSNFELGVSEQDAATRLRGQEALLGMYPGMIQASGLEESERINMRLRGGEAERQIANQQNQADYFKYQMAQPWANPWLQFLPMALTQTKLPSSGGGGLFG
jgi:hypothetical protein